jgi:hypothetical protein
MEVSPLLAVLALATIGAVIAFAVMSKRRTEERRRSDTPKSTLASDAPNVTAPGTSPPDT